MLRAALAGGPGPLGALHALGTRQSYRGGRWGGYSRRGSTKMPFESPMRSGHYDPSPTRRRAPASSAPYRVEEEFTNAIRGKEEITMVPFETGVHYMEWTEAVIRSAQTGQAIYPPL